MHMLPAEHGSHFSPSDVLPMLGRKHIVFIFATPLERYGQFSKAKIKKALSSERCCKKMEAEKTTCFLPSMGSIFDVRMCFPCSVTSTRISFLQHLSTEMTCFSKIAPPNRKKMLPMLGKKHTAHTDVRFT